MLARKFFGFLLPLTVLACEGSEGPMGPEGPQGPPGPGATVYVETATVGSDGTAQVSFSGLQVENSLVNCWLSDQPNGPWLKIGTDIEGPTCGAGNSGNNMLVGILSALAGWYFTATAVTGV